MFVYQSRTEECGMQLKVRALYFMTRLVLEFQHTTYIYIPGI